MRRDPAQAHSPGMTNPVWTATRWGAPGTLAGALLGVAVLLPFYPDSAEGFAELGWMLAAAALAAAPGLLAGALATWSGLRRAGAPYAGRTALVFVPTALLLGAVSAGVGALAAPAAARWLVDGLTRRPGWGPQRGGLAQRLVLALVGSALLATWGLSAAGHELGGRVGGAALTWAAVLPAVVVLPVLLLRKVVRWPLLAGGIALAAALLALAVPGAVAGAHPTPERLEQIAHGLGDGAVRTQVHRDGYWEVPVTTLDAAGPAERWQQVLREEGWEELKPDIDASYFLPDDVQASVVGSPAYGKGLWLRAFVVPRGDGVRVVLAVRP